MISARWEPDKPQRCSLSHPDALRLEEMQSACVAKWMTRMSQPSACVSHFAGVSSPSCTASDLRQACLEVSARFTVADAEQLCSNLQGAHHAFWSDFWSRQ